MKLRFVMTGFLLFLPSCGNVTETPNQAEAKIEAHKDTAIFLTVEEADAVEAAMDEMDPEMDDETSVEVQNVLKGNSGEGDVRTKPKAGSLTPEKIAAIIAHIAEHAALSEEKLKHIEDVLTAAMNAASNGNEDSDDGDEAESEDEEDDEDSDDGDEAESEDEEGDQEKSEGIPGKKRSESTAD